MLDDSAMMRRPSEAHQGIVADGPLLMSPYKKRFYSTRRLEIIGSRARLVDALPEQPPRAGVMPAHTNASRTGSVHARDSSNLHICPLRRDRRQLTTCCRPKMGLRLVQQQQWLAAEAVLVGHKA